MQTHREKKDDHEKTEADDGYLRAKERGHRINQFCWKALILELYPLEL